MIILIFAILFPLAIGLTYFQEKGETLSVFSVGCLTLSTIILLSKAMQ